jgi:puromycin-sensitive aminopeptidase
MIEGYLGEERFRDGIRAYMRRHAKANAVADDLWRALGEASREPVVELANAWIRSPGFPVVDAAWSGKTLRLAQRRFFSEPGAAADGSLWPVPIVLKIGAGGKVTEQRVLLRDREAELALAVDAAPDFVVANAAATGFYRVRHDAAGLAALVAHLPRLETAERIALLADEWALVRAGAREVGSFLDLCAGFAGEEDHAVLDELVARLAYVEHRLVADADRPALAAFVARLVGGQLAATGWDPRPDEPDAQRLRRAAAVRALALVARDPAAVAEARRRLDAWIGGDRAALEPNLHDAVVVAVARGGDGARFEALRGLFRGETDPTFRRRWLLALAAFEDPGLAARAVELAFGEEVPIQDTSSFAGTLLGNRTAREPFWDRLRRDWGSFHARRLASAPMLLRRVVEAMGSLVERRHLQEVEAFLGAHPLEEARQATAQTLERMRQDVELRERTQAAVGAWLRAR